MAAEPRLFRSDILLFDSAVHWLVAPYFPEHWDHFVFPVTLNGRVLYAATSGLVLTLPQENKQTVSVEGRTGEFSSRFRISRQETEFLLLGTSGGQPVNLKVHLSPGRVHVAGTSGKENVDYVAQREEDAWKVTGKAADQPLDYHIKLVDEDTLQVKGQRMGEVDYTVARSDKGWTVNGTISSRSTALAVINDKNVARVEGTFLDENTRLSFETTADEIRITGNSPWGKVNYTISEFTDYLQVKGRVHKWFVSYKVAEEAE